MQTTLVSIIIPTINEGKNIKRILDSVKKQTYKPIEVLVVDKNSTDNTKLIAKKSGAKVINFGPERSAQRNFGAKKSKGAYLLFLDADMELSPDVVKSSVDKIKKTNSKMITIAETTVGEGWIPRVRKFEREMYMGEANYEVQRFFERDAFFEFDGYDTKLTGPEDYDLPFRMRKKYRSERVNDYIYHHEEDATLSSLLKKKFYYASRGASYASKHPDLVWVQGTILFRSVYLKNWNKFLSHPFLGISFLLIRTLETISALFGFVSTVGIKGLALVIFKSFNK